jgi:hypothetical protein
VLPAPALSSLFCRQCTAVSICHALLSSPKKGDFRPEATR